MRLLHFGAAPSQGQLTPNTATALTAAGGLASGWNGSGSSGAVFPVGGANGTKPMDSYTLSTALSRSALTGRAHTTQPVTIRRHPGIAALLHPVSKPVQQHRHPGAKRAGQRGVDRSRTRQAHAILSLPPQRHQALSLGNANRLGSPRRLQRHNLHPLAAVEAAQ